MRIFAHDEIGLERASKIRKDPVFQLGYPVLFVVLVVIAEGRDPVKTASRSGMAKRRNPNSTTTNAESKGSVYEDFLALNGYQTVPSACYESGGTHCIEARLAQVQAICPRRGVLLPMGKVLEELTFTDVPRGGKPVVVHVKFPRRYCPSCKEPHSDHLPGLSLRFRISLRLIEYVYRRMALRLTDVWIALETGLDPAIVRKIRIDWERKMERERDLTCPEFLGIDDIYLDSPKKTIYGTNKDSKPAKKTENSKSTKKIPGRKPSCIITDIGAGRVIELKPTIKMDKVKQFLSTLRNRERLQAVAMDLTDHFEKIVRDSLPGIPIVRDKAHVITEAKERFNKIRTRISNAYVAESEKSVRNGLLAEVSDAILKELIRKERAKRKEVKKDIQRYARYFVWPKSKRPKKLEGEFRRIFRLIPGLKRSYSFLQKFYALYEQEEISAAQASSAFNNMKKKLDSESQKYWKPFFELISSYDAEIWAYFDSGLTNAQTEAMNRTIRQFIAAGRGMRHERLRAMLLYTTAPSYIVEGRARRQELDLSRPGLQVPRPPHARRKKKVVEEEVGSDQVELDFDEIDDYEDEVEGI